MKGNQSRENKPGILAFVLLVITLMVAFLQIDSIYTFPLLAMWIALALGKAIANIPAVREKRPLGKCRTCLHSFGIQTENRTSTVRGILCFLTWNFGSQVAVYVYTVLLVVFGVTETRFLSTNIMTFINGLSAASILYLFGKRGVTASIAAICAAWVISAVRALIAPEFEEFWKNFELHDMSFGAGYILLYYLFVHTKWDWYHRICCGVVAAIIAAAFKRIGIAALTVTVVLWVVLRYLKPDKRRKVIAIGSLTAVAACYLFVAFIVEGWFIEILGVLGINPMGRNYYYGALAERCTMSPLFLGLGRNAAATLFSTDWAFMRVGNVHSDLFRMYAECGFVVFGAWLLVYWWFLPRAIEKKFGYQAFEFFVLCTVYTFVVYATDNTELYLINQYFYMLMTMHVALSAGMAGQGQPMLERLGERLKKIGG